MAKVQFKDGKIILYDDSIKIYSTVYIVTWKDWDGTVLRTEAVDPGGDATPPADPTRLDYVFTGWSGTYTNVNANIIITAQYVYNPHLYAFTSHTFTPCGATGMNGPTFTQMKAAYAAAIWELNTAWFNSTTQGYQLWTVPKTGSYTIEAAGAKGSDGNISGGAGVGGKGAKMKGTFALTKGDIIKIIVGQVGLPHNSYGGGGGGGTFVLKESGETVSDIYVIAGGGGGGGIYSSAAANIGKDAPITGDGTASGGGSGTGGTAGSGGSGGGSAYNGAGGAGLIDNGDSSTYGGAGNGAVGGSKLSAGLIGGRGGIIIPGGCEGGFGGAGGGEVFGGGGGGYSGGAGGTINYYCGGGAGGSYNNGASQVNTAGANNAAGYVIITQL